MKLIASTLIAALLLTGTAVAVSVSPGQGVQLPRQNTVAETTVPECNQAYAPTPQVFVQLPATEPVCLTRDQALDIALDHAGLTKTQISRLEREFDRDRGHPEWDIEFVCDGFEYSYEIHAESGAILEWDKEWDD